LQKLQLHRPSHSGARGTSIVTFPQWHEPVTGMARSLAKKIASYSWNESGARNRSLDMTDDAARLRSEAERCRRLAENVSSDEDQALLKRIARDFDEAADELEQKRGGPSG